MTIQNLRPKNLSTPDYNPGNNKKNTSDKTLTLLQWILIALPILSLTLSALSWLKYGVDIPIYDDWRQYSANDMGRLDLAYLFTPHNDTLYTFGLLLDSLAFRFLDGNAVAYQFVSMIVVLGGLLFFQWKLLSKCTSDKSTLAIAFAFSLLMLQPDTYWGFQSLAYHQAIPLVCLLGILTIALRQTNASKTLLAASFLLASVAGLTYISGAFTALTLCAVFLIIGLFKKTVYSKNLLHVAGAIMVPALVTTAAQLWVIVEVQHGTHRADAPMAFPWESDFWYFLLGKIGRSLMLPMSHPTFSLIITVAVTALVVSIALIGFIKLNKTTSTKNQQAIIVTLSLSAIVFVYLLLISAGRTNMRPDDVTSIQDIFIYGFYRFHFFWVTLLWPWVALILLNVIRKRLPSKSVTCIAVLLAAGFWAAAIHYTSILSSPDFFKATMKHRSDGLNCLFEKIQKPGPVICSNLELEDISQGVKNGRVSNASFARTLPLLPIALGTNNPAPAYRLTEHLDALRLNNADKLQSEGSLDLAAHNDPNVLITVPSDKGLTNCQTLSIVASMTASEPSIAQVFYITPQNSGFSEEYSTTAGILASPSPQALTFTINSPHGFGQEFRFDPVTTSQKVSIKELEIRCRSTINAN